MKKLILLVLVVAAAWYGWKKYPEIVARHPSHEAIIANQSGLTMERVRLTVDGQTFVRESIDDGASTTFEFRVGRDTDLELVWQWKESPGEFKWRGGRIPRGPMVQRHQLTVDGPSDVVYQARHKQ